MKKALPLTLVLIGAALLITAVVFWIDSSTSTQPDSFGKSLRDWITLVLGIGASLKGWMDLFKKEKPTPPTQNIIESGVMSGNVQATDSEIVFRDKITTTNIVSEDSPHNVEGLPNPYLGLQAFTYVDRDRYAGREKLTDEALQLLVSPGEQPNLLFVTGASGSGKSSFVQAGLLPALVRYYQQYSQKVKFEIIRPSRNPVTRLKEALKRLGSRNVHIIVIDQFEELFTQSIPKERDALLDFLYKLKPFDKSHLYVIATLRSDYLPEIYSTKWLWDFAKQSIELREMGKQELKDAILRPLQVNFPDGSKRFDPELVEKLAVDTAESVTYLPLLQVTLEELWNRGNLKLGSYNSLTDAIEERAGNVLAYRDFDRASPSLKRLPSEREEILNLLLSLVNPSPNGDIKHDVSISRELSEFNNKHIDVLRELSKARLVSIEVSNNIEIVNLIHETLIRSWDTLRDRVNEMRLQLQKRARFEAQLELWILSDRAEDYLLSKGQVAEARDLEQLGDVALNRKDAQDLLQISTKKLAIEQQRGRMLSAVLESFSKLSSTLKVESLNNLVLDSAVSILGAEAGGLFLVDKRTEELVLTAIVGSMPNNLLGRRLLLSYVREGDAQEIIPQIIGRDTQGEFPIHSSIVTAIQIKDRTVVGFINVINKHDKLSFSEDDQILLSTITAQAAIAFENAELLTEVQRSNDRLGAAQMFSRMAFSATTSVHEFRNHIGAIKMLLQLIDITINDDEKIRIAFKEYYPKMIERINKVAEILVSLHTPWQVQQDTFVNVNACITRAIAKTVTSAWETESWIRFETQDLPGIKASQDMLTEAIRVLIRNAIEAIQEKAERERSLILKSTLEGNMIEIIIQDNGVGISPENLNKIFEMRFSAKTSGLGFGLFWARDYIEGLGGTIAVSSILGQGTTFIVHLPVVQE